MLLSLYAGATGMEAQQLNLNTISNNLANVNTTGFKQSKMEFADLLYQNYQTAGADGGGGNIVPTSVQLGNGTKVVSTSKLFTQGQLSQTGKELDLAIEGVGFFEVDRGDGTSVYTRDGALKINANGQVVNNMGLPLLGGFQAIPAEATEIYVSSSGQFTVVTPGGTQTFQINLTRFPNPGGLKAMGGNLFEVTDASGAAETVTPAANGAGMIRQGFLEMSNVNVAEEMVNMIIAQRAYEINSKAIQTSDDMLSRINQLKR